MFINGAWEARSETIFICRWLVAWENTTEGGMIGAIAGYSGGGSFEVERFRLWSLDQQVSKIWVDFTDRLSKEEIDFNTLPPDELLICEEAIDKLWEWNDSEVWNESDNIVLIEKLLPRLIFLDGLYVYQTSVNPFLSVICEKTGLTSAPTSR
jgi:hypothetical protein